MHIITHTVLICWCSYKNALGNLFGFEHNTGEWTRWTKRDLICRSEGDSHTSNDRTFHMSCRGLQRPGISLWDGSTTSQWLWGSLLFLWCFPAQSSFSVTVLLNVVVLFFFFSKGLLIYSEDIQSKTLDGDLGSCGHKTWKNKPQNAHGGHTHKPVQEVSFFFLLFRSCFSQKEKKSE